MNFPDLRQQLLKPLREVQNEVSYGHSRITEIDFGLIVNFEFMQLFPDLFLVRFQILQPVNEGAKWLSSGTSFDGPYEIQFPLLDV